MIELIISDNICILLLSDKGVTAVSSVGMATGKFILKIISFLGLVFMPRKFLEDPRLFKKKIVITCLKVNVGFDS